MDNVMVNENVGIEIHYWLNGGGVTVTIKARGVPYVASAAIGDGESDKDATARAVAAATVRAMVRYLG